MMNKGIIITILILLISIFLIVKEVNNKKQIPSEYPKYRTLEKKEFILGKFWPLEEVKIKSEISGIIEEIYIRIGDSVHIGTQIAKLRIIPNPENIEITKRAMQLAKVDMNQKQIDYNRNKKLFDKGVIAKIDLEKLTQDLKNAQIEYNFTKKNYNIALKGYSTEKESRNIIKSTINGYVTDIPVKKGMNITERNNFNEGNTIAIIANLDFFIFEFDVEESLINKVEIGDEFSISIKALGNASVVAKIVELKPSSENIKEKFSYTARAKLLDNTLSIKSGFSGLAEFLVDSKKDILTIKEKNIIYKGRKAFVELIEGDDKIKEVEISRGISDGIYTEITEGVSKSSKVKIQ